MRSTSTTSPARLPASQGPVVIQTGTQIRTDITLDNGVVQMRDIQGFRLSVAPVDENGEPTRVSENGALVIEQNDFVRVTGAGFLPGSDAVGWLFSDPYRLGVVRVESDGTISSSLLLGDQIDLGRHTIQFNGLNWRGEVRSLSLAVELVAEGSLTTGPVSTSSTVQVGDSPSTEVAPNAINKPKMFGTGQASGWIGLLMLLMLIIAYIGEAPLIDSRRRLSHVLSAVIDDALSMRTLGARRYALSVAGATLVMSGLASNGFLPTYPTALGFVALTVISAVDPLAGLTSAAVMLMGVTLGGGAHSAEQWRAAIVVAATYSLAPLAASAIARRLKRSSGVVPAVTVAMVMYLAVVYSGTRIVGALLRSELSIDRLVVWLLLPSAVAFAVRWMRDQNHEKRYRGELRLRRPNMTPGLLPTGIALLAFVVLSDVLIDDESLLTLLVLGVVVGIRKLHFGKPAPRSASPSRSRRSQDTSRPTRRPPTSRTR